MHIEIGIPFKMIVSNYTTEIKSDYIHIRYLKNAKSSMAFMAYSKVQKDVKGKECKEADVQYLKYYQTGFNFSDIYADELYNIDIKSAYASILLNDGYITQGTFDFMAKLPKQERLAAVGMLAGRKHIFHYDEKGEQLSFEEVKNPNGKYFFYAVEKTFEVMDYAKMILGNSYCFSWVDSVYFSDKEKAFEVQTMLADKFKLKSSFDVLNEFEVKTIIKNSEQKYYNLRYRKGERIVKNFSIPYPDTTNRQAIFNYLIEINKKDNLC